MRMKRGLENIICEEKLNELGLVQKTGHSRALWQDKRKAV